MCNNRVRELEDAIREVVTQQGDDLCWMDIYTRLGKLVGVVVDPTLLPDEEMLANCKRFISSLRSGCPYKTGDKNGVYYGSSMKLKCGYCQESWDMDFAIFTVNIPKNYFCPFCGKQQHFI